MGKNASALVHNIHNYFFMWSVIRSDASVDFNEM